MEAGFGLEPLSGEAGGDGGAGRGSDAAGRQIACGPGFGAACVGAEHWPPDVVGADEGGDAALNHGEGGAVEPDILPDQRVCRLILFGDSVPGGVEDVVDGDAARQRSDRLPPGKVVFGGGFRARLRGGRWVTSVLRFLSH